MVNYRVLKRLVVIVSRIKILKKDHGWDLIEEKFRAKLLMKLLIIGENDWMKMIGVNDWRNEEFVKWV